MEEYSLDADEIIGRSKYRTCPHVEVIITEGCGGCLIVINHTSGEQRIGDNTQDNLVKWTYCSKCA